MLSVAIPWAIEIRAVENSVSSEVEQEIWALEETYLTAFENANHDVIASMLHADFLGWPRESARPSEKSDVARFLKEYFPKPLTLSFELERAGIRVSGDVVITHYLVMIRGKDEAGAGQVQKVRMTHTWIKEGDDWKILGGMSCTQHAENPAGSSDGNT
jgi:ketosteroid isomerase-like protein